MASLFNFIFLIICANAVVSSKLNLPRVLLPLLKFSPTNFTLEISGSGCYKWTLSRLDVIQIIPLNSNKHLDCSTQVILSTITKEFTKNTVIVLVEEISTKERFRCDVIVDVISSLNIVTKTRELFVEESPEIFEVRAYDDQGNEFSTLEGVRFTWTISSGRRSDVSGNDVIRFTHFKDSSYEIPKSIHTLDIQGLMGHIILLEGVKTGTANISVELSQHEYRHVPPTVVQLNVIANLIIEPFDTYMLPGDVIFYKLLQVKNGRFVEVPLPSTQYSLIIEDTSVAKQLRPWVVEAIIVGQTKLLLSDINSKMSDADSANYLPSVTLNVVSPAFMNLVLLPHKNWITTIYHPNSIVAEIYDSDNHKIYIGPYSVVKIDFDSRFKTFEKTRNGSYIDGYANALGTIHITGELSSVRSNDNVVIPLKRVTAEADILVYPDLAISPSEIALPWDPVEFTRSSYQLNASGGDGLYQWSIGDENVALITQSGVLKPRNVGNTEVLLAIQKNPALVRSAKVTVASPVDLKIVYSSVEAELGSPIYLAVALYYKVDVPGGVKTALYTDCSQFPFVINVNNQDFFHNGSVRAHAPENACATVLIVGNNAGSATVTVSYVSDGIQLKEEALVTVYQPLRVVSPKSSQTLLAVGAQRYVVLSGGPSSTTGDEGHHLRIDYNKTTVSFARLRDEGVDDDLVYLVTCRVIGETRISFKVVAVSPFAGADPVQRTLDVHVICGQPHSVRLHAEMADSAQRGCPASFRQKHVVLNNQPIVVRTVVLDEEGKAFDNATSLECHWTVSDEKLVRVQFDGVLRLKDEDKGGYRLPLYHYQTLLPNSKTGVVELAVAVSNYQKLWLKTLRINADDATLKIVPHPLRDTITLTLVNSIHISSEFVSVFNHPQNVAKLYISQGSGFYKVTSSNGEAAQVRYAESSKSVDIVPVLPGAFSLTVKDECLNSEAVQVSVFVLTVSRIDVDLVDKIEKGKSAKAVLRLFDSDGMAIGEKNLLNLKSEADANIVRVDCEGAATQTGDDRIVCLVSGLELGNTNLVFRAGPENAVVRSAAVRVQVYPPLRIVPSNVTLVPGAVMQLTVKGGPQPDCLIEYSTNSDVIVVDNVGYVMGNEIGECLVFGRAVGARADGEKVIYSESSVRVNVVQLEGIRINVPLTKIKAGAKMPIWVEGIPELVGPLVLASLQPKVLYKWDVSSPNLAHVYNLMDETGVKLSDSEKVSMRLQTLKSGRVIVSVTVIAPGIIVPTGHKGVFTDAVNVEIFDELNVFNDLSQPMLLAPSMRFRIRTNKDRVARVSYKALDGEYSGKALFDVDKKGLVVTHTKYGLGLIEVTSVEDNDFVQVRRIPIKISRVQYMMLNILPELQVNADSSLVGWPKGAKLQFYVSYHDNEGNEFSETTNNVKFVVDKQDKIRISQNENDKNIVLDLLDVGTTAMKIYDQDSSITPDFVRINVIPYVQPDKMKLIVGDAVCFTAPKIKLENHECSWNSSNDQALAISKKTGFGVAKSKQNNIVVSYQCTNNLQIVTTADVYSLQKIEILASGISNISNNGKRTTIPLVLKNDADDPLLWRTNDLPSEKGCLKDANLYFYPYECSIEFSREGSVYNIESAFRIYPKYDLKYGHTCVIESEENAFPVTSQAELEVVVKVTWNKYESTSITIPFKPAVNVINKKLSISDQDPVNTLRISGSPAVLDQVQVVPSNSKYIAIVEEISDVKSVTKYAVYLKPVYLKESSGASQKLAVWVVSEITDQNITVPIDVNVNIDHYVTPHYTTDQITYYFNEYAVTVVITLVICVLVGVIVSRLYKAIYAKSFGDNSFANLSHDRSHFSSPTMSHYSYKQPSFNEIQMIYGQTPEKVGRIRRGK